ncbi:RISC-loading complex subunit tarbp2-like [Anoplophora glabripennis]|uniref:RISC-loading complex subunit tarbp2-like n=1 Tax=Anoplophora glabripennis TaxID=217634 RepID=UPI00087465DC|nr:RISC-loading complex subunit tarbp2-like [Anoplophora glabripennis]
MTTKNTKTPAMVLQEFSVKNKYAPPTYEIISSITGTHANRFDYRVTIAGIVAEGTGTSKQIGKHNAAHNALVILKEKGIYDSDEIPGKEFKASIPNNSTPESPFKASPNCVGPLKDLCMEYKIPDPIFMLLSDVGPPHSREFTFECSVASIKTVATGNTKKMAKQLAAKEMLERIRHVIPDIAEQYSKSEGQKAITNVDVDMKVLNKYNEFFGSIVPDKTVEIGDYSGTLKKLMADNELIFNNFSEEFSERTEESLKKILDQLGLNYNIYEIQDNPPIVTLSLNTDTPFTTIGMSMSKENAKAEALSQAFEIMEVFMRL